MKRRLLVGVPTAVLTLILAARDLTGRKISADEDRSPGQPMKTRTSVSNPGETALSNTSLPGWYGEKQQDGVLIVVNSFDEKSEEAARFSRRLTRPASYATLTLINLGRAAPLTLSGYRATLHLGESKSVPCVDVAPLLRANDARNKELAERLTQPQHIAVGGMLADLPLCAEPSVDWSNVTAVTLRLGDADVTVPGRLMSQKEKAALLTKGLKEPGTAHASGSAESWFKNL